MAVDIYLQGVCIGHVVRRGGRDAYGYTAEGLPIGAFADADAAIAALIRLYEQAAAAPAEAA